MSGAASPVVVAPVDRDSLLIQAVHHFAREVHPMTEAHTAASLGTASIRSQMSPGVLVAALNHFASPCRCHPRLDADTSLELLHLSLEIQFEALEDEQNTEDEFVL